MTATRWRRRSSAAAAHVHAGNHEVLVADRRVSRARSTRSGRPALILDERAFPSTEVTVFSFGMAHKIRTDLFERLRDLLGASGRSYAVYLSAANHETTKLERRAPDLRRAARDLPVDALVPRQPLRRRRLQLSALRRPFSRRFFLGGVRANNGSVAAAMEKGAVVITNLDEHSPPEFVHLDNLIDIGQTTELPLDTARLEEISRRAQETARERGWTQLVDRLR
jgi:hypothetical protein